MKNIILAISLTLFSTVAFSQNNVSELIQKYKGQKDVSIVTISGNILRFGSEFLEVDDKESKAAKDILEEVDELIILNTQTVSKSNKIRKFANRLVNSGKYEEMTVIDSDGDETTFYGKVKNQVITELFVIVGDNKNETTLISITGKIDPDSVDILLEKTRRVY